MSLRTEITKNNYNSFQIITKVWLDCAKEVMYKKGMDSDMYGRAALTVPTLCREKGNVMNYNFFQEQFVYM